MGSNGLDNNRLTYATVNVKTRDQLRRIETGKTSDLTNGHGNGNTSAFSSLDQMDGERRPLLGNHVSSTLHPEPGFWRHLLVNARTSPGIDSPNPFVRYPARVWNVTKVTLFSCMYPTPAALGLLVAWHGLNAP